MTRHLLFISIICLLAGRASGQGYSFTSGLPLAEISGTGTPVAFTPTTYSEALPIGFGFKIWDRTYSDFYLSPTGMLTFAYPAPGPVYHNGSGGNLPPFKELSSRNSDYFIAFAWHNAPYDFTNATINYFTSGTAPNRVMVVNYKGVSISQTGYFPYQEGGTALIDVQLQLYEGSEGKIEMHNTNNQTIGSTTGGGPGQLGLQGPNGQFIDVSSPYRTAESTVTFITSLTKLSGFSYVPLPVHRH